MKKKPSSILPFLVQVSLLRVHIPSRDYLVVLDIHLRSHRFVCQPRRAQQSTELHLDYLTDFGSPNQNTVATKFHIRRTVLRSLITRITHILLYDKGFGVLSGPKLRELVSVSSGF